METPLLRPNPIQCKELTSAELGIGPLSVWVRAYPLQACKIAPQKWGDLA